MQESVLSFCIWVLGHETWQASALTCWATSLTLDLPLKLKLLGAALHQVTYIDLILSNCFFLYIACLSYTFLLMTLQGNIWVASPFLVSETI